MRSRSVTPAAPPRAHFGFFPRKPLLFAGALLALAAGIFTSRVLHRSSDQPVATVPASPGMAAMIYPLHCMTPEQAVAFVGPIVRSSGKAEVYGAEPHAILIQAPVPIASAARAALKERDAAACKLPAAP